MVVKHAIQISQFQCRNHFGCSHASAAQASPDGHDPSLSSVVRIEVGTGVTQVSVVFYFG
jgi:hypothetical protein